MTRAEAGTSGDLAATGLVERFYSGLSRMTRETQTVGPASALNLDAYHDASGIRTKIIYPNGRDVAYRHNQIGGLTHVYLPDESNYTLATYSYVGREAKQKTLLDASACDNTVLDLTYSYDQADRAYDRSGRITRPSCEQ